MVVNDDLMPNYPISLKLSTHGGGIITRLSNIRILPGQTFTGAIHKTDTEDTLHGTTILFNLPPGLLPFYQTGFRVRPLLEWCTDPAAKNIEECPADKTHFADGVKDVYIGNIWHAVFITLLSTVMFFLVLSLIFRQKREKGKKSGTLYQVVSLLCDSRGELSLSLTQMALWTLAIGAMVTVYGLTRLEIPAIPEELVALMGMSLATSVLSHRISDTEPDAREPSEIQGTEPRKPVNKTDAEIRRPQLKDLLMVHYIDKNGELKRDTSLAKAQLLFWTLLVLFLFVVKSLVEGVLWQVPWEMVVLMGMSQSGYLFRDFMGGDKLNKKPEGN